MTRDRIYLDHAATTPIRPEVRDAMEPYLGATAFGNPSSLHADGQRTRRLLDSARGTIAAAIGAKFAEVSFTSGGTEADNAALAGIMLANRSRGLLPGEGLHLITTQIEHEAVLRTCRFLESLGIIVTYLAPDIDGLISADQVESALTPETALVSVMHANNEVGTVQPVAEIAGVAHAHGAWFHTDAVQTFGQIPIDVDRLGVDLLSMSAHKLFGPKGVGALYVREGIPIEPLLHGGSQERERRAGTENVAGIAGFAAAATLALAEREEVHSRVAALRDRLIDRLLGAPGAVLNGHRAQRLPGNVNMSFPPLDAVAILLNLDMAGISASSGSACSSGSIEPSHVLTAMGLPDTVVRSAIRFTLGRTTTESEVDRAADATIEIVRRLLAGA